jgi:branched-chain amino acid aminotransferase
MINVNSKLMNDSEATIPILDRGFLYGDSIYETLMAYKNSPLFFPEHFRRLTRSARFVDLRLEISEEQLLLEIQKTLTPIHSQRHYIRTIVTRGVDSEIDLAYSSHCHSSVIIIAREFHPLAPAVIEKGVVVKSVSVKRNPITSLNPMIKSGNYLNNILAKSEARKKGAYDALLQNQENYIAELSTSNIFWIKNSEVYTPSVECGILDGVIRNFVIHLCKDLGIPVYEGKYTLDVLLSADEAFITSTLKDILPICQVDDKIYTRTHPDSVLKTLMNAFHQRIYS